MLRNETISLGAKTTTNESTLLQHKKMLAQLDDKIKQLARSGISGGGGGGAVAGGLLEDLEADLAKLR